MLLQDIKETKRYGHFRSFVHSDGQRENSIPTHTQFAGGGGGGGGGYNEKVFIHSLAEILSKILGKTR